ncbi:hypothetical protein ACF0H5_004093 [Mactra antiquata]
MGCGQSQPVANERAIVSKDGVKKGNKNRKEIDAPAVKPEPEKPKSTYANYLSSHDAKLKTETECALRGVTFMQDGNLVLADYKNNKLKLFDSNYTFLAELELSSAPWDVCQATDRPDDVFVTVPYLKTIHRISVTKISNRYKLVPVEAYRTQGFCWGITCFDGGIAISAKVSSNAWPKPPEFQVHIHEFDGTFRRSILYDTEGKPFFEEPKYLNVTYDDLFLLVSDYKRNTVLCINNEDELIFAYSGIQCPNGIAMDEGKNLHIASFFGAQRVHKVGANGKYKDGLQHDEDRPLFPHGICYRQRDKIIVMTTDHFLEVYKLV